MRKKRAEKRLVTPDPRFNDVVVTKFINGLLYQGKKNAARRVLYGALDFVAEKTGNEPLEVLKKALSNVSPALEVRSRRVGGATYQVPMDVRPERRQTLGIRWIIRYAGDRREKGMTMKLANELIAASNGEGASVKKREDTHRMAEANKAFAHFKW